MAYIGKEPIVGNFQKCDAITVVNGQAAYTLQVSSVNVSPESANHMLVSLNGILQAPTTSFTVSGSTLTFASNLATGDVIDFVMLLGNVLDLGVPSDATVSTAKIVDGAVTSAKLASGVAAALTGSTNNTIVTVTGADAIAGEATLTYDGTTLANIPSGTASNLRLQNSTTGSGGTDGFLLQATGSDVYINNYENADMYFRTNNTDRLKLHDNGVLSASAGVALGVGTANTASNVLDDYEEGTFTPNLSTSTGVSLPLNSAIDVMSYTKIGRVVHIQGLLRLASLTSPSGAFTLFRGLPFTTSSSITQYGGRGGGAIFYDDVGTGKSVLPVTFSENTTQFNVYKDASGYAVNDDFQISLTYFTDA